LEQRNPDIPARLSELGEFAAQGFRARSRGAGAEGDADAAAAGAGGARLRWAAALQDGLGKHTLRKWRRTATAGQRVRQGVLASGVWMLQEPQGRDYGRIVWLVAVRLWFGLDIWPAIPDREDVATVCQNRYVVHENGRTCLGDYCKSAPAGGRRRGADTKVATPLDAKGRHALVCKVGGAAMARHDYVRDVLGTALRRLVSGVRWERYVAGITRTDGAEKSRLDLVVSDPEHAALLDLVVFYPLQHGGVKTYARRVHERAKVRPISAHA